MQISDKILSDWSLIKGHKDAAEIAELADCHPSLIRKAFRTGEASERIVGIMAKFYRQKKKRLKKLVSG